jgi:hypothetical protein
VNRKLVVKYLALLALTIAAMTLATEAQQIAMDVGEDIKSGVGYFQVWDSVQGRLILYRDVSVPSDAGLRLVDERGNSVPIFPLKDFPDAQKMTIWSAAATPEGGVVFSAIASYGPQNVKPRPIKSLLLTYNAHGELTKVWDVAPYHHFHVAVDEAGNVYALGVRDSTAANYPMVVVYSPEGQVVREFFPANTYPVGDSIITSVSSNGRNRVFIVGKELLVWLAEPKEALRFSLRGDLLSRVSFAAALDRIANPSGEYRRVEVSRLGQQAGQLVFQVQLWPKDTSQPVKFAMITTSLDGSHGKLSDVSDTPSPGRFLGTTTAGKLVFLEEVTQTTAVVRQH